MCSSDLHLWSHEGETVVASECTREIVHLRRICHDIGIPQRDPTEIWVDNEQTVIHSAEIRLTDKGKHLKLRDLYIRERMMFGDVCCKKARGEDLAVDCNTKQLQQVQHERHFKRRSEERRVGQECRARWSRYHYKKKKNNSDVKPSPIHLP